MIRHSLGKIAVILSVIAAFIGIDSNGIAIYVCAETLMEPDTDNVLSLSDIELHDGYAEYDGIDG